MRLRSSKVLASFKLSIRSLSMHACVVSETLTHGVARCLFVRLAEAGVCHVFGVPDESVDRNRKRA